MVYLNFSMSWFFKVVYSSGNENEPGTDHFMFFKLNPLVFYIIWQETVLTHKKGVLELVKEQKTPFSYAKTVSCHTLRKLGMTIEHLNYY